MPVNHPDLREMVPPIIPEEPSITDEPLPVGVTAYKAEHRLDGFWTKHVVMADRNKIEQAIIRCADEGEPYDMEVSQSVSQSVGWGQRNMYTCVSSFMWCVVLC